MTMPIAPRCLPSLLAVPLLATAVPATGCLFNGFGGSGDVDGITDPHSQRIIETNEIASCRGDLSPEEVADNVQITFDFEISAHEMVACGGLVYGIVGALVEGLVEMAQDPDVSTLPEGFTFEGGTYYVQPSTFDDVRMEVRFYFGRDYAAGAEGELITDNLFTMSSFLVDASAVVTIDTSSGVPEITIELSHGGPGPLVELLGMGADPPSPIFVTPSVLADAQRHLRDLQIEPVIFFADHPEVATIEYDVSAPVMLVDTLLNGTPMQLDMIGADGWRDDLGQDLDVDLWTIEYADDVGALEGDIEFTTRGGSFDYVSSLHYDASGWPEITLRCAP